MSEIPWTPAVNPANALTLQDVWKQPSVSDMLSIAAYGDSQQNRRIQGQINALALKEMQDKAAADQAFSQAFPDINQALTGQQPQNALAQPQGQPQPQPQGQGVSPEGQVPQGAGQPQAQDNSQQKLQEVLNTLKSNPRAYRTAVEYIQQSQQQTSSLMLPAALKMLESDDPDQNERGYSLVKQLNGQLGLNIPLPDSLENGQSYKEFSKGLETIINNKEMSKEDKIEELTKLGLSARGKKQIEASKFAVSGVKSEIEAKGTGAVADAVKQVTSGKKQFYSQLNPAEKDAVDQLVQKQAFNVKFGGELGGQKGSAAGSQYSTWTQEQKDQSFENYIVNKTKPAFPWRDPGRTKWEQDYNQYLINKGISAEDVGEKQYYRKAQGEALSQNEKYYGATKRFVSNIDDLSKQFLKFRKQYGPEFGKMVNTAVNNITQGIAGSGDIANLQQYLTSISLEVAKVESGELGIQAATESQQKLWAKIHNFNFDYDDIEKVLNVSSTLGHTRIKNLEGVRNEFRKGLSEKEKTIQEETPPEGKEMASMPDPKANKGKTIRDTATGQRYKSDGTSWKVVK